MNVKQYTFAELAEKQVVNVADGRQLGHTCDMVFTAYGRILGLVVPGKKSFFKSFTSSAESRTEAVKLPGLQRQSGA